MIQPQPAMLNMNMNPVPYAPYMGMHPEAMNPQWGMPRVMQQPQFYFYPNQAMGAYPQPAPYGYPAAAHPNQLMMVPMPPNMVMIQQQPAHPHGMLQVAPQGQHQAQPMQQHQHVHQLPQQQQPQNIQVPQQPQQAPLGVAAAMNLAVFGTDGPHHDSPDDLLGRSLSHSHSQSLITGSQHLAGSQHLPGSQLLSPSQHLAASQHLAGSQHLNGSQQHLVLQQVPVQAGLESSQSNLMFSAVQAPNMQSSSVRTVNLHSSIPDLPNSSLSMSAGVAASNSLLNASFVPPHGQVMINYLDSAVNGSELTEMFRKFGPLHGTKVVFDERNQSRGFGFVYFVNPSDALTAIRVMDGQRYRNRDLRVHFSDRPNMNFMPQGTPGSERSTPASASPVHPAPGASSPIQSAPPGSNNIS